MEELKIKVDAFIDILKQKNESDIEYNILDNKLICSCAPYTVNGSCRFCYRFNKVINKD